MRGTSSVMERFEELSISQRELLSQVEQEASSWRNAYDAREHELSELRKELAQLKISKVESNAATPLLLCLIDGDGCIFNESLLAQGLEGGRAAASKLRYHIMEHYTEDIENHFGNPDILVHVFFNREGLGKTIKTYLGVQPGTFNAFINGFNTASPLMSMLDVGTGKEAADAKIREHMRIFVRYPNVKKIYFGGGHDNGYCNNLTTLQNEGYLRKIVLLQGYSQLAAEIKALELPCLENNGIFLSTKLSAKSLAASSNTSPAPGMNRTKSANKSPVPPPAVPVPPKSQPIQIPIGKNAKANIAFLKSLQPRACNDHYLTRRGCKTDNCPYGHDYDMPDKVLADFRDYVKQNPCLLKNKGQPCDTVECPSAHQCPQGPNCTWHKQGNCKFVASGMHGTTLSSEEDDDRVLVGSTVATLRTHNRTGSSSSSMVDFPDYPSPTKKPITPKRPAASSSRTQVKNAFKSSVSGSTTKERLQQMGVGSGGKFVDDDDDSDSSEQPLGRAQHFLRPGVISFVNASEPTGPSGLAGLAMNRHTPNPRVF